jgi:hypothetical protein
MGIRGISRRNVVALEWDRTDCGRLDESFEKVGRSGMVPGDMGGCSGESDPAMEGGRRVKAGSSCCGVV